MEEIDATMNTEYVEDSVVVQPFDIPERAREYPKFPENSFKFVKKNDGSRSPSGSFGI